MSQLCDICMEVSHSVSHMSQDTKTAVCTYRLDNSFCVLGNNAYVLASKVLLEVSEKNEKSCIIYMIQVYVLFQKPGL